MAEPDAETWVDTKGYFGRCRREQRAMRLINRRETAATMSRPSLATMLRRLRVAIPWRWNDKSKLEFLDQARRTSIVAREIGNHQLAQRLDAWSMSISTHTPPGPEFLSRHLLEVEADQATQPQ
jgi:hypothetical protein